MSRWQAKSIWCRIGGRRKSKFDLDRVSGRLSHTSTQESMDIQTVLSTNQPSNDPRYSFLSVSWSPDDKLDDAKLACEREGKQEIDREFLEWLVDGIDNRFATVSVGVQMRPMELGRTFS